MNTRSTTDLSVRYVVHVYPDHDAPHPAVGVIPSAELTYTGCGVTVVIEAPGVWGVPPGADYLSIAAERLPKAADALAAFQLTPATLPEPETEIHP